MSLSKLPGIGQPEQIGSAVRPVRGRTKDRAPTMGAALDLVLELLKPEHFYSDANGRIYDAALKLDAEAWS